MSCHERQENDHVGLEACIPSGTGSCRMPSAPPCLSCQGRITIREPAPPVARTAQTDEPPARDVAASRPIVLSVAASLGTIDLLALQLTRLVVWTVVSAFSSIQQSSRGTVIHCTKNETCQQPQELGYSQQIQRHLL